ncbi:COP9 signalosome complex subunit 8 [Striga asiatica]|uniref:COP9 signalosome complex subunit 8 n=1 Tax=Striga asiatica TaxID=4170 RepID=A0A5A7PCZ0_STRAF|nr:COP9 signalosome complex subunit 8 [Striga asiatica]
MIHFVCARVKVNEMKEAAGVEKDLELTRPSQGSGKGSREEEEEEESSAAAAYLPLMDFSALNEAVAFKSYDRIAEICDSLMLQVASEGVAYQDEWPYAIHLLGHIYVNDINSARFLWKKVPSAVKVCQPEVSAVWKIGQKLWIKDYGGVHEAIREFNWTPQTREIVEAFSGCSMEIGKVLFWILWYNMKDHLSIDAQMNALYRRAIAEQLYTKRMFDLLLSAYSTISIQDTAVFLGMKEDDATNYALGHGWTVDPVTQMLTVQKQAVANEQKLDPSKLQRLTEYVFHLEH